MTHRPISFIKLTFFFSFFIFFGINNIILFGVAQGLHIMLLLWSFWTLCLPLFGGGLLLAPLFEPFISLPDYILELCAWVTAGLLSVATLIFTPHVFQLTPITHLLSWILTHPFPYWIILATALAPVIASWLHERFSFPSNRLLYAYLQFALVILSFLSFSYITMNDLIILSNIHA